MLKLAILTPLSPDFTDNFIVTNNFFKPRALQKTEDPPILKRKHNEDL
jgi:hypothetical protein